MTDMTDVTDMTDMIVNDESHLKVTYDNEYSNEIAIDNDVIDYDTDRSDDSDNENENPKKWQKLSHSKSNDNDNNDNENPIINNAHPSRHVQIRRERNRIHARHARERKKAHMDTLEQRIQMLIDQVI
jgi:hypothetical protein